MLKMGELLSGDARSIVRDRARLPTSSPPSTRTSTPASSRELLGRPARKRAFSWATRAAILSLTMYSTTLASALYLLLLRWLARDYEAVFSLCACCSCDTPPTAADISSCMWQTTRRFR